MKKIFATFCFWLFLLLTSYSQQLLLTSNNSSIKDKNISSYKFAPSKQFTKKNINDRLLFTPPTDDIVYIDFVGSGDIQKSISEGKDINANTGLGVIFERFTGKIIDEDKFVIEKVIQSLELEGIINIATTADTITSKIDNDILQNRRNFGTYILNPISARQSLFINSNVYFGYPVDDNGDKKNFAKFASVVSGINFRVISSNILWQYKDINRDMGVLAFRAGIFHEFIPDNYRLTKEGRSKYSLFTGINYAYRGIFGDISSSNNDVSRTNILGSSQKRFQGLELNFGFRLNNLRAEFQMPMLKDKDSPIEGLTNTQFQFSVRFVGGFSLKIKESSKEEDDQQ